MPDINTEVLFHDCPYPVAISDLDGQLVYANAAWDRFWAEWHNGTSEVKQTWKDWIGHIADSGHSHKDFYATREIMRLHANYSENHGHITIYGQEMTETAQIDDLTNLPRLYLLKQRLANHVLEMASFPEMKTVLAIIDIKDFKAINLRYSYATGDAILMELADRIRQNFPQARCLGRIAGNEFAIAYESGHTDFAIQSDLEQRQLKLQQVMSIDNSRIKLELALGVVISNAHDTAPDQLLAQAQLALNHAREHNIGLQTYCPKLAAKQYRRLCIREEFNGAIEKGQFHFVYEPQILLATGAIIGAEVLARWAHPTLGNIPPVEFIAVAEATGKISKFTCYVLEQVFAGLQRWRKQGIKLVPIAVNISAQDLLNDDLLYLLTRMAHEAPELMRYLQLEITETCLLKDIGRTLAVLAKIKQFGLTISIDDFGTGYSSLSYLSRLAADNLKIDHSFVANIFLSPSNQAIVQSILDLAKRLQMQVCAEGVETLEQSQYLREWGCQVAQGHYFYQSLDEAGFLRALAPESALNGDKMPEQGLASELLVPSSAVIN